MGLLKKISFIVIILLFYVATYCDAYTPAIGIPVLFKLVKQPSYYKSVSLLDPIHGSIFKTLVTLQLATLVKSAIAK